MIPIDDNNDSRRDLTLADFPARFDRDNNPSDAQRMGIPNILQVEAKQFTTVDQAIASLTMTDTTAILNTVFKAGVEADRAIKPLLLFAREHRSRQLGLDLALASGNYVTRNAATLTVDLAPAGQPASTVDVMATIKWVSYCAPDSGPVTFSPCEDDAYWETLDQRYASLPPLPSDSSPDWMGGRVQLAAFYYTGLRTGFSNNVQMGNLIPGWFTKLENESGTATSIRTALQNVAAVPLVAAQSFHRLFPGYVPGSNGNVAILKYAKIVGDSLRVARKIDPTLTGSANQAQILKNVAQAKVFRAQFRVAAIGIAAMVIMVAAQILSMVPTLPTAARGVVGGLALALNLAFNVVFPIVIYARAISQSTQSVFKAVLATATPVYGTVTRGAVVGLVIGLVLVWGFFIYGAAAAGLQPGSPELNRAFFEAVAATIVMVVLFIFALNPIGLIISSILGVIDGILSLTCELGVSDLRKVPGMGGACFTINGLVTKALTKLLYSYDVMINLDRSDLMVASAPQVVLVNPSKGFAVGNSLSITLPVTTTAAQKDPDPNNGYLIYPYLYLFSKENLKRSTFKYSLSQNGNDTPSVALDGMKDSWQNLVEDHKYIATPLYRATASSNHAPLTGVVLSAAGINVRLPITLNMAYALPAYECWTLGAIPICYIREFKSDNHMPISSLVYDVYPTTLDDFMTLTAKPGSGFGLAWSAQFPTLRDADGDGLISAAYNGSDPNDNAADSDNDGLTDRFELEKQAAGQRSSPIQIDSDSDGLTDFQEARLGTNPAAADSDNDGLKDGEEVYHLRYDPTTGLPTTIWEGGWSVTINAATPFTVRVSADPLNADGDNDGVNDLAERQLAQDANPANRVDNQNRPYHPNIVNTPPLAVLVATDDLDGYVAPGQSFRYTSTVIANTAVAPGILTVNAPAVLGGNPNPLALRFEPLTFNTAQTITQAINQVVGAGIGTQAARISSMVNTRLPNTGPGGWRFAPITAEAPLTGLSYYSAIAASRPDRQDSYWLNNLAIAPANSPTAGDLLAYSIPGGTVRAIENDNNNTWSLLQPAKPSLAANGNGDTVAVWGQQRLCNVMTINSLKVVTAGPRPLLTFQTGGGSEDNAWAWTQGTGGGNVASGTQFGPNANGFPVRLVYCGNQTFLRVYNYNNPPTTPNTLINTKSIDPYNPPTGLLTFSGAGATIEVSVSIPLTDSQRIGGTLLGADGTLKRSLNFPTSPIPKVDLVQNRNPVVASDGNGFLAAYESFSTPYGAATWGRQQVVLQAFDQAGNALGQSAIDAGSLQTAEFNLSGLALAAVWEGSSYRIVWQNRAEARIWQVRANANGQLLSSRESLATDAQILASDALSRAGMTYAPSLAYDPLNNRTLLTYLTGNRQIKTVLYIGNSVSTQLLNSGALSPQVAWHPGYQGWLLSYQDSTTPSNHFFIPLNRDGAPAFPSTSGFTVATAENSLACPAPQSAPVVDLRWEELPGDNALSDGIRFGFYDSSGYGNHALCRLPGCPAAGVSGAPNAPLSDYAVQFDGVDDGLEFTRPVQDNFTIAFWLKAPTMDFGIASLLVDGGDPAANGFNIWLISGSLVLDFTGTAIEQSGRIDDGAWHFVTVSRNKSTGRVEAYVDGNSVVGVTGTAGLALNGAPGLVIGKGRDGSFPLRATLDHFQIIPTVLAQDAIQAIYNRTNQSYCLAAGAANNNLYWSKVQASQPDVRGGRISASNGLTITIDSDRPTASFSNLPNGAVVAPGQVIGGSASDATSGVGSVAVSINNGAWLTATGANSWAFSLAGYSGAISLRVRATDNVGNVGNPSAALNLTVDNVAPTLTINTPATTLKPSKNAAGRWQVPLNGTANDANGIQPASLLVNLQQQSAVGVAQSTQPATLSGSNWSSNYLLNDGLYDPTGAYTVTVQAADRVGNRATPVTTVVRLDARGPEAVVNPAILARQVITPTLLINGVVSDTNSIAGIDKLEIAFTPIEQIAALPPGLTSEQAEALLNRTWMPVTLAQRGAGVTRTTWSFRIPAGLENSYQLDLRGFDLLGNVAISSNVWRGIIDTRVPRTAMRATVTGASYFDTARNQRLYEVRFLCGAQDRYLNESTFTCPGEGLAEPVRTFDNNPAIQALFPDLTIRTGLALSYTLWVTSTTPAATVRACDRYGRCGTTAIGAAVAAGAAVGSTTTDGEIVDSANIDGAIMEQVEVGEIVAAAVVAAEASASAPMAVIVNPTHRSFVAAGNGSTTSAISVTVAAEAGAGLKDVTIKLDNATVQTLSFAQSPAITRTVRTINVPVTTEGPHTLVAQATAWDNSTQSTLFPVVFTLDQNAPSLTIDASALTIADTWQAQSGVLRFNGNASDSVGLAAVQIKEGDNEFTDATFGNGAWRVALPVEDPEGRNVVITVRAIDRAGRITTISQQIATDLSAVDAPDTRIIAGPTNPSAVNSASFVFTSTVSAFECSLDDGVYTPCATPTTYNDLSKGSHTFRVRAIDSRGLPDLSPAEYTWTVNATALDVTITNAPATPTSSRSASFAFSGNGASYECSLDGAAFAACVSPANYSGLSNGEHSFLVRARNGGSIGAAARHLWTIANAVPVAASQTISTTQDKAVAITLTATDEDAITYRIVSQPDHGLLLGTPPALSYTPNTGFVGTDSFTFVASDGQSESAPVLVTITVGALPPPTTANVTIVLDMQPNSAVNQAFVGSLGTFRLDDASPDDNDGIPNRRTFTVAPGSYTVRHNKTAWVTTALACTPTTGAAIDLNAGSVTLTLAAGNNVTCTFTQVRSAQITARAFEDRVRTGTNLGRRNAGDPWVPGSSMTLFTAPGAPVATLVTEGTAVAGLFEAVFRFLRPGAYMLCTTLPAGWTTTTPAAIDPAYGQACKPVTLNPGQAATLLFGAYPPVVAAESESFTPEEEVITDDDTIVDLPEDTTEETPGAMVNQIFLPLAAR